MASLTEFGNKLYTGEKSFPFVAKRKIWLSIAAVMIVIALVGPWVRGGYVFGIEFTGGSEFTVSNVANTDQQLAIDAVSDITPGSNPRVSTVGGGAIRVQTDVVDDEITDEIIASLATTYEVEPGDVTSSFIGPSWGADITGQAIRALLVFVAIAALFMALYFRTWKMSFAALIALVHDLIVTAGVYGLFGFEVTPAAVIGFLTILGYSLYDTVVVFDKIRENTAPGEPGTFLDNVNLATNQTLVRSINTSVVALLPVASILVIGAWVLGAGTLRDIALALFIGILVGTYSTIFIAAPIYAELRKKDRILAVDEKKRKQERGAVV
ncbi:protein translocase subunit SecF [Humidisolicoccus flavus]|uniref:protein translocase subunit SecF n=1 Tax=Humidisolicoccus flavus TaxID=3111414 RepID=UPI00324B9D0F